MDAPRVEMTQAEYARHRGVSRQAIGKFAAAGKVVIVGGKVDVVASDRLLGETRERVNLRDDEPDTPAAAGSGVKSSPGLMNRSRSNRYCLS